jgi:hypothetical protein
MMGGMNPGMIGGMNPMMGMMNPMMGMMGPMMSMMNPMRMMGGGMGGMNPMSMMGGANNTDGGYNNADHMSGMMKPEQYTDWFNQMMKQFTPAEAPVSK